MAKKNSRNNKKKSNKIVLDKSLPQNILLIGECVEEDKKIYISQTVYKEIHTFAKNKTTNERGGVLVGIVTEAFGKANIVIHGFIEAKYCEATSTTLKFTHETWDYVHKEIEKKYEKAQILGWIHTHPDFGIFLSEYDKFIQKNFFNEENQIAYVIDPIQHIEGFYFWINERIEKCKGFYIFDKTGISIELEKEDKKDEVKHIAQMGKKFLSYTIVGVMVLAIIIFVAVYINLFNRMEMLEKQQENIVKSANQSIIYLQQKVNSLEVDIKNLQNENTTRQEEKDE